MIHHGDLFDVLPTLAEASIDACVTDPPYGIGFMGREWDTFKPGESQKRVVANRAINSMNPNLKGRTRGPASSPSAVGYDYTVAGLRGFQEWSEQWAREVHRVLKPGAYLVVCGAPRSYHRMACGLEDAGFVIRDKFSWLFGQGFPKNYNLGDGKGTALKPAHEPIALAWKPFKGSIKGCHEAHGTAALNVDACRLEARGAEQTGSAKRGSVAFGQIDVPAGKVYSSELGRWPSNVLLDEEAAAMLDEQAPETGAAGAKDDRGRHHGIHDGRASTRDDVWGSPRDSLSGASRFFYVAKPSREERNYGCDDLPMRRSVDDDWVSESRKDSPSGGRTSPQGNYHPTVKPVELMRWLVKLVTPISGTVLDPFGGSFTTAMACRYEHRRFIIVEREAEYVEIGVRRVRAVAPLFGDEDALQVRRWPSGATRAQDDVLQDGPVDPLIPDSILNHSACPDPCDGSVIPAGPGHE